MLVAKLFLAIVSVAAIKITAPTDKDKVKAGEPVEITWQSVSSDPEKFNLAIQIPKPFTTKNIAEDVETSKGSYSWTPDSDLSGDDYKIHFLNPKDDGILAESGSFEIEEGSGSSNSSSSNSTSSGTSKSTATSSDKSSGSGTASGSGSGTPPNVTKGSGAAALVPSLVLVAVGAAAAVL